MYTVGIDIGGTSIKIGIVDDFGNIIIQDRFKTQGDADECLLEIVKLINDLMIKSSIKIVEIRGIGVGCPGSVDNEKGIVKVLPNLEWKNYPLSNKLKDGFNVEVVLSNDANVAALAEAVYGCAKGYETVVMLTLGTGVGGGVVINNKLYEGGHTQGIELGHITLVMGGKKCTCGRRGCVERYVSATALIEQTKAAMIKNHNSIMWKEVGGDIDKVSGETAFSCELKGDKTAKKVIDKYVKYLSEGIMNTCNVFRPDVVVLGGGISAQGKNLTDRVDEYCKKFDYGYIGAPIPKLLSAKLGDSAGIIGAAALITK